MTAPLINALPLVEGETLTGYVSRSAKLFETTPRDFCSDLGMRWPQLCSGYDDHIERLAWLLGKKVEQLIPHTVGKVGSGRFRLGKTVATFGVVRRTAVRFCPKCVCETLSKSGPFGAFQLIEWAVMPLQTCPKHNCLLMTLPSAKHAHTNYDFASRVLKHLDLVQGASRDPKSFAPTPFEIYLRSRLWIGPKDDWLKELDLTQLHRVCLNLGAALDGCQTHYLKSLETQQERKFCQLGFEYLEAGASRYRVALQKLHMQSKTERPYYTSDLGPFYQWLREFYDVPSLKPLVDLTCEHIFETYPTPIDKEVFGQLPTKQNWFTMHDASKLTGFGVVFLKKLLGHMNEIGESDALKRTDVHVDELASAKSYWSRLMTLKDVSQSLGLPVRQIKALQDRGVLDAVKVTSSLRYAKKKQVEMLLRKVNNLPVAPKRQALVPLRAFCRDKGVEVPRLIELWSNGELECALFRGEEGFGFQAIEVACDAMCANDRVQFNRDLQLSEVARYLQISVISVRQLRNHGYLCQLKKRNVDTNRIKSYISKESILAFEKSYVTLGQMSAKQKIAPIHLARKLDENEIPPISCGGKNVRVYEKSAVGWET